MTFEPYVSDSVLISWLYKVIDWDYKQSNWVQKNYVVVCNNKILQINFPISVFTIDKSHWMVVHTVQFPFNVVDSVSRINMFMGEMLTTLAKH